MGHARALINIENPERQLEIYQQIVLNNLSVREVEDMARGAKSPLAAASGNKNDTDKKSKKGSLSFEHIKVVEDLRAVFNTKVNISREPNGKGKIVIPFKSETDLKRILDLLDA
jgi:ParB family chromosome partitioning protein